MNLSHLHYFITLADEGHFANAAKSLFIARSTLSLAISQLERELGAPLFTKSGSSFTLTPYGKEFHRYASLALQNIETGKRNVAAMVQGDASTLRLGVPFTMQNADWSQMLRKFRASIGDTAKIQVQQGFSGELLHELSVGNLDLTFAGKSSDAPDNLTFLPWWSHELVIVVNRQNPLAERESLTLADLEGLHIHSYAKGCQPYEEIALFAEEHNLDLEYVFKDEITICSMVSTDDTAVAFSTYSFLMGAFKDIVCIPIEGIPRDFHWECLVYRNDGSLSSMALRFVEYAKSHPIPNGYLPR
jgi:DNA-binding transcriptional LysR family regulator